MWPEKALNLFIDRQIRTFHNPNPTVRYIMTNDLATTFRPPRCPARILAIVPCPSPYYYITQIAEEEETVTLYYKGRSKRD